MSTGRLLELHRVLARFTINERLEACALEMQNLQQLSTAFDDSEKGTFEDIEAGEYARAIQKARGDWEPPDPPGFEGGFAPNH